MVFRSCRREALVSVPVRQHLFKPLPARRALQFAYFLPMLFAAAQVFFGAWLFLCRFLRDKAKSVLAMVLFFLNGGFGFAYFLTGLGENSGNFTRIFTAFYETRPTSSTRTCAGSM